MNPELKSIRKTIKKIRKTSSNRHERAIKLRILFEMSRVNLYDNYYKFESIEQSAISFLFFFVPILYLINVLLVQNVSFVKLTIICLCSIFLLKFRKHEIDSFRNIRIKKEMIKTRKVLMPIKKNDFKKLSGELQDWYMIRRSYVENFFNS